MRTDFNVYTVCQLQSRGFSGVFPMSSYAVLFDVLPEEGLGKSSARMSQVYADYSRRLSTTPILHADSGEPTSIINRTGKYCSSSKSIENSDPARTNYN